MMRDGRAILLAEHDSRLRTTLASHLTQQGYCVREVSTLRGIHHALAVEAIDLALVDLALPGAGGLDLLSGLREAHPAIAVIALSGHDSSLVFARAALQLGAIDYVFKPVDLDRLCRAVMIGSIRASRRARVVRPRSPRFPARPCDEGYMRSPGSGSTDGAVFEAGGLLPGASVSESVATISTVTMSSNT